MAILSDLTIKHRLVRNNLIIAPFDESCLQPNSYDIHLHPEILYCNMIDPSRPLDPEEDCSWAFSPATLDEGGRDSLLVPDACMLARTIEYFEFPNDLCGRLEGVSTNGRVFLKIHITAGFFDAGFKGTATLEIKNLGPRAIVIRAGMRIGQMSFEELTTPSVKPYGARNRYLGQIAATPTRTFSGVMGEVYSRHAGSGDGPTGAEETVVPSLPTGSTQGSGEREPQEPGETD
jgi:dCTP deaminase